MSGVSKLTNGQWKFLDLWYTKGMDKKDAYYAAGFTAIHHRQAVARILKSKNVIAEITRRENIKEQAAIQREVKNLDALAADLDRNNEEAFSSGKISESNKAIELLIRMQGGFQEKIEVTQGDNDSSDQIDEIIRETIGRVRTKVKESEGEE